MHTPPTLFQEYDLALCAVRAGGPGHRIVQCAGARGESEVILPLLIRTPAGGDLSVCSSATQSAVVIRAAQTGGPIRWNVTRGPHMS
jgi:hypothetical protein